MKEGSQKRKKKIKVSRNTKKKAFSKSLLLRAKSRRVLELSLKSSLTRKKVILPKGEQRLVFCCGVMGEDL